MTVRPDLTRIATSERRKVIEAIYGEWTGPQRRECWCGCGKTFYARKWFNIYYGNHRQRDYEKRREQAYLAYR